MINYIIFCAYVIIALFATHSKCSQHVNGFVPYCIFLGGSPTPFMFEGFTGMRSRNIAGEYAEMALFQTSSNVNPLYSFSLPLYRKVAIKSSQTSTHSSVWDALKGSLGGCFH